MQYLRFYWNSTTTIPIMFISCSRLLGSMINPKWQNVRSDECSQVHLPEADQSHVFSLHSVNCWWKSGQLPHRWWEQEKMKWFNTGVWYNRLERFEISVFLVHVSPCIINLLWKLTQEENSRRHKSALVFLHPSPY